MIQPSFMHMSLLNNPCAARRRVVEILICFFVADGPKNVKFVSRIDGNVEPKRAVRKPSPSNEDVRLGPLPFLFIFAPIEFKFKVEVNDH